MQAITINTDYCDALVSPQGAQLLQFTPKGGKPWLYYPNLAIHEETPIDAGIPLCLPWFGRHKNPNYPIHGYLRQKPWLLHSIEQNAQQAILHFDYLHQETELFPYLFSVRHSLYLSRDIRLQLTIKNLSMQPMPLSFAWHSYFATNQKTVIGGLKNKPYFNYLSQSSDFMTEDIVSGKAIDAVFENCQTEQQLNGQETLFIDGENCPSCIVWQPDKQNHFICLERGAAFSDSLLLAAGQAYQSQMIISERL